MMKITLRYVWADRKNSIRTICGILFSVMLMFSLLQIGECFLDCFEALALQGEKYDLAFLHITNQQKQQLEDYCREQDVAAVLSVSILNDVYLEENLTPSTLMWMRGDLEELNDVHIVEGNYPQKAGEICLEQSFNEIREKPFQIGDSVQMVVGDSSSDAEQDEVLQAKICGFTNSFRADVGHVLVSPEWGLELEKKWHGGDNVNSYTKVMCSEEYNDSVVTEQMYQISSLLWGGQSMKKIHSDLLWNDSKISLYGDRGLYVSARQTMQILSVVIGICMVIFIYSRFYAGMIHKMHHLGIMRCLGVTKWNTMIRTGMESFLLGGIGIAGGLLAGNILNFVAAEKIIRYTLGTDDFVALSQRPYIYISTIGLALASLLLGVILVGVSVWKIQPVQALNYTGTEGNVRKKRRGALKNIFVSLANRNGERNRIASITQILTMAAGIFLCLLIVNGFASIPFSQEVNKVTLFDLEVDAMKNPDAYELDPDAWEQVSRMDGVKEVCNQYIATAYRVISEHIGEEVPVVVLPDSMWHILGEKLDKWKGIDYLHGEIAVLQTNQLTDSSEVKIKTTAEIPEQDKRVMPEYSVPLTKQVTEPTHLLCGKASSDEQVLMINRLMAEKLGIRREQSTCFLIRANAGTHLNNLRQEIIDVLGEENITIEVFESNQQIKNQFLAMILQALYIFGAALFISIAIIANTIRINLANRQSEYGIMRAMGMEKKELYRLTVLEHVFLFGKAVVISFILAFPVNVYVSFVVREELYICCWIYPAVYLCFLLLVAVESYFICRKNSREEIVTMLREM